MTNPSPYDEAYWKKLRELRGRPVLRIEELAGIPGDEIRRKYGSPVNDCLMDVEGRYENEDTIVGKAFGNE